MIDLDWMEWNGMGNGVDDIIGKDSPYVHDEYMTFFLSYMITAERDLGKVTYLPASSPLLNTNSLNHPSIHPSSQLLRDVVQGIVITKQSNQPKKQ